MNKQTNLFPMLGTKHRILCVPGKHSIDRASLSAWELCFEWLRHVYKHVQNYFLSLQVIQLTGKLSYVKKEEKGCWTFKFDHMCFNFACYETGVWLLFQLW